MLLALRMLGGVIQMSKLYIAGKMAGVKDFNHPAFFKMEYALRALGHDVVNPAALDVEGLPEGVEDNGDGVVGVADRAAFLLRDFKELLTCDGLLLLDGWEGSVGANCELLLARIVGMGVYTLNAGILVVALLMPDYRLVSRHVSELFWNMEGVI